MTSLVTGATGFIGRHLVRRLVSDGERVRTLARPPFERDPLRLPGVEMAKGDLLDPVSVRRACAGVDLVYHAGAVVSDWGKAADFFRVNVEGTKNILEGCAAAGVKRFVHLSSASVYGYPKADIIDESFPFMKRNIPYVDSKIEAEKLVVSRCREEGITAVALRPTQVYGPGCTNYVLEILSHILDGSMLLLDGGRHIAGLCYVDNLVDALVRAGREGNAMTGAYTISDASAVTWREYVNALARIAGRGDVTRSLPSSLAYGLAVMMELAYGAAGRTRRPLLTRLAVLELGRRQNYDISRARAELGFDPAVQFEEGMDKVADWLKREGRI